MKESKEKADMDKRQPDQNSDYDDSLKNTKKKNGLFLNIILVLCILVFLGCGGYLGIYFYTNYKAEIGRASCRERV